MTDIKNVGVFPIRPTLKEIIQEDLGVERIVTFWNPDLDATQIRLFKNKLYIDVFITDEVIVDEQFDMVRSMLKRGAAKLDNPQSLASKVKEE